MKRDTKIACWVALATFTLGPIVAVAFTLWVKLIVGTFL